MMVRENVVDVNGKVYNKVVKPGLTVYQSVKHKKKDYISHLHERIFKRKVPVYDVNGEQISVEFAKAGETVQKDGAKNPHPVLGKLEEATDRLEKIAIINIKDLLKNSEPLAPSSENSHQWLDDGGWRDRISYMTDRDIIYPVILHIPKTRDGRYLLYDVSVLKKEGTSIDMDATALAAQSARAPVSKENGTQSAVEVLEPSGEKITQPDEEVKQNSDDGAKMSDRDDTYKPKYGDVTESQQFRRWFGDWIKHPNTASKIVNPDGTPKVMYHGSPAKFTIFDKKKAKSSGLYGRGFYFTDSESHASTYGERYAVYLNIKNPLQSGGATVTRAQVQKFLESVAENEDYSIENYGSYDIGKVLQQVMGKAAKADAFQVIQDISATAIGDMVEAAELLTESMELNLMALLFLRKRLHFTRNKSSPQQITSGHSTGAILT